MDFESGYISEFTVSKVDPSTWANQTTLEGLVSVTINKDCTDEIPMLETANITLDRTGAESFEKGWYRIEMLATQGAGERDRTRYPLATVYLEPSSGSFDKGIETLSIDGYSVLKPLSDRLIFPGEYVPKDSKGLDYLTQMLDKTTPAPVNVEGSFYLNDYYVFDPGTSYLKALWDILNSAGWCLQVDGTGAITIKEVPKVPKFNLDREALGVLIPGIDYSLDLSSVPNRYLAVGSSGAAMVVNNDPNSPVSYANKGWYVDVFDSDPMPMNGESLNSYAKRQLIRESTVMRTWTYTREFVPDLRPFDLIYGSLPEYGFDGNLRVLTQRLTCTRGITVTEKVGAEIKEWSG